MAKKKAGPSRAEVFASIAKTLATCADAMEQKDFARFEAIVEPWVAETLCDLQEGEWASFEKFIFDVQAQLDPDNVDCESYEDPKFVRHVIKYAAKWKERAAKAADKK